MATEEYTPEVPLRRCSNNEQCIHPDGPLLPATTKYFHPQKGGKYGLRANCRKCENKRCKDYLQARRKDPEYRERLRLEEAERCKDPEYRAAKAKYMRDRLANDPEFAERNRKHNESRKADPEKYEMDRQTRKKKYKRLKNDPAWVEKQRERNRERRKKPNARFRARVDVQKRNALRRNLPNTFTPEQWQNALNHFGNRCAVCGRPQGLWHTIAMDHWIPLTAKDCPGTVASNIVPLCHARKDGSGSCNRSKHNKRPLDWLTEQLGKRKAKRKLSEIEAYLKCQT